MTLLLLAQFSRLGESDEVWLLVPYARRMFIYCPFFSWPSLSLFFSSVCLSYWEEKENMDSDFRCQAKWDGPFKDTTRHTAHGTIKHLQAFVCLFVC
jgi:hypothetical protein